MMKNGLLVWNIVLTLVVGFLLVTHFTSGKKVQTKAARVTEAGATERPFRIAYFEMDSVENHYDMVKDVQAELSRKEEEYSKKVSELDYRYRKTMQDYQDKERAGTLTQQEAENAPMIVKRLEESIRSEKQALDQDYQEFAMRRNLNLRKKIEEYVAEYNKNKEYSYIVSYEQGLFYYKDTIYNITSDLIRGLNEAYKKKKD